MDDYRLLLALRRQLLEVHEHRARVPMDSPEREHLQRVEEQLAQRVREAAIGMVVNPPGRFRPSLIPGTR